MRHGSWWALLPVQGGCLSLGLHVDTRRRRTGKTRTRYGPYVDLHLGRVILSLGVNPVYAGRDDLDAHHARGGVDGDCH
jgi:hypothetical protein